MTPADRRITELIDKWLTSIDLHLQYVELSDAAYARVQPWQKHDRPTRWVLEVARQKVLELKQHCETRQAMGDSKFSESLELMAFLANLVGIQHIQRFVPLADPTKAEAATGNSQTVEAPTVIRAPPQRTRTPAEEPTREMPQLKVVKVKQDFPLFDAEPAASRTADNLPAPTAVPPRQIPSARPAPKINPAGTQPAKAAPKAAMKPAPEAPKSAAPLDLKGKIIADAVRLLKWGKPWHELAELIARIAERPAEGEIRKVLRAHKAEIEKAAQA
ncbi:hypothetical protein [Peristeroidobacter agariperforans]|uniref:hypothetical protein n=1 Tax=Peristeroidobacter agariperforans TaxID=268404 RepID=UPI00101DF4DF|nr:hypothetical protein [Peristeroidobacter agariperforans]